MAQPMFKVLVADDEYWIRENLRTLLDWPSHAFVFMEPAEDGEQALAMIKEQQPDIVITDVNMPFLSGTELIEAVHAEQPAVAFIALSGYSDYAFVRTALVAGAVDYLLKPISKGDLLKALAKAVDRILESRAQEKERQSMQEQLRIASSAALDRELSRLIRRSGDRKRNPLIQTRLTEYELDFSGFTLVVFRTARLQRVLRNLEHTGPEQLVFSIKELIADQAGNGKSLVFNYTYKNNEFILITDMDASRLPSVCDKLVLRIRQLTGFPAMAIIGRHYFSFSALSEAYNDTLLALLSQSFANTKAIIFVANTQDTAAAKRVTPEQENGLQLAVATGNRALFQRILYGEIRLQDCRKSAWRFVEVRQTADSVAWILKDGQSAKNANAQLLILDHLAEMLSFAVDSFDADEMLGVLEQMLDEAFEAGRQTKHGENMRQIVAQVKDFIDRNYFAELSLTALSQQFHAESSYLSKVFKQNTGDNLMLYIAKKRVEKAKALLAENKLSITEISQLVGYGDYAYFSRVFRKLTGVSPRDYKEQGGVKG